MVVVETTVAVGVLTSILTNLPKEILKHYINRVLNRDDHLKHLAETLAMKIDELKRSLEGVDQDPAGHSYLHSDWADNLEQLRYDLEDIRDSGDQDGIFTAQSLNANIRCVNRMLKGLAEGAGYTASHVESSVASLYRLPVDDSLRGEAKRKIIQELTSTTMDQSDSSLGVCIIGICGLGKTVLAKAIANEASIRAHFPCIVAPPAYAPDFSLRSILEHIRDAYDPSFSLMSMWGYFKGTKPSKDKRVLVLLDGIPAPDPAQWALFRSLLGQSGPGSKFLITTQNPRVADVTGTSKHFLEPLTEDECLLLIKRYASNNGELPAAHADQIDHNKKGLAGICRGLPLLANYIGLHLLAAQDGDREAAIRELVSPSEAIASLEWVLASLNPVSVILKQPHLKRCMSYCSLFPRNYEFRENTLLQFWMAEGFTRLSREETNARRLRTATKHNFRELRAYSLFRASKAPMGEEPRYAMDELAYDLARHVAYKVCCRTHIGAPSSTPLPSNMSKVRHFSLSCEYVGNDQNNAVQNLLRNIEGKCLSLRTFLLFGDAGEKLPQNPTFFQNLTHLRVLDLSHTHLTDLRYQNISKLKCLRYLNLSHTPIKKLPKLSSNRALQVLKLKGCNNLEELPPDLSNLTSLISLQVNRNGCLGSMLLPSIAMLRNLQELDKFTVGTDQQRYKIEELANLDGLRGSLHIAQLENVAGEGEAQRSHLHNKGLLNRLELEWTSLASQRRRRRQMGLPNEDAGRVLQGLQPPNNLKQLILRNYYGSNYPQWLNTTQVCGALTSMHLDRCEVVPLLDQLRCLKTLRVEAMDRIPHLGHFGDNRFPYIEELVLCGMSELSGWIQLAANNMPRLCDLRVDKCRDLQQLPLLDRLTSLKKLQISRCAQLTNLPPMLPTSLRSISVKDSGISQQEADGPRSRGILVEIDSAATHNTVGVGHQRRGVQQGCSPRNLRSHLPFFGRR